MATILILFVTVCLNVVLCRDFYMGMFKKNDFLVAQDTLYKERVPFRAQYAKFGRRFKCPITYVRVVDRLGVGKGPRVEIIRGGLLKKFLVLRLTSPYNSPISVNIYIGCENKMYTPTIRKPTTTIVTTVPSVEKTTVGSETTIAANKTSTSDDKADTSDTTGDDSAKTENDATTVDEATTAAGEVASEAAAEEVATEAAAEEVATEAAAE